MRYALLALLLSACSSFTPIAAPAAIVVTDADGINDAEFAIIEQAAREWNVARPGTITSVTRGEPTPGCGRIYVRRMRVSTECDQMMSNGCTRADGCTARVLLARLTLGDDPEARYLATAMHEIAHALIGEEHSDVPGSILSQPWDFVAQAEREITPDEAARVRGGR